MRSLTLHRIIVMCICFRLWLLLLFWSIQRRAASRGDERRDGGVAKSLIFAHYMRTVCFHNNNANIWFRKRFLHHLLSQRLPYVRTYVQWTVTPAMMVQEWRSHQYTYKQILNLPSFVHSICCIAQFASLLCEINLNEARILDTETNTFDESGT